MTRPREQPGFGALLLLILTVYALIIVVGGSRTTSPLRVVVLGGVLVVAVRMASRRRSWIGAAVLGGVGGLALSVVATWLDNATLATALTSAAVVALVVITVTVIVRTLLRRGRVDVHAVTGALSVYLLLALFFSSLHQLLATMASGTYVNGIASATDASAYLYFSVTTLTTVGFGDITAASPAARAVVVAEALIGQLYLVSVVAAVVGRWTPNPNRLRRDQSDDAPPG